MEREVLALLEGRGPLTGGEIADRLGGDGRVLWRVCALSPSLEIRRIGRRYLRLDRRVDQYVRLSPSILREFLTYSVVGRAGDESALAQRARELEAHIEAVSKDKLDLAYRIAGGLFSRLESEWDLPRQVCFIIAGDIVFNMAHDVPRPERSTGKLVRGSDLDLIVVLEDEVSDALMKRLDEAIYQDKYRILIAPALREEIDYVVKRVSRVREQVRFDTFKRMVACKILQEGQLLYGSRELFEGIKALLRESGVTEKLEALEREAVIFRREAEACLLSAAMEKMDGEHLNLFYPTQESEEFE